MTARHETTGLAFQLARVLSTVPDDDTRRELRDHFDDVLDEELAAGRRNRAQFPALMVLADGLLASIAGLRLVKGGKQ